MKIKILIWLFIVLYSGIANASSSSGKLDIYWVLQKEEVFLFKLTGTVNLKPACNTQSRYAVSLKTDSGRTIKDMVISSKENGLDIVILGRDTCTAWGDSEDINYIGVSGAPSGSASSKTFAVCFPGVSGGKTQTGGTQQVFNASCNCGKGKLVTQNSGLSCSITSETGSCSASTNSNGLITPPAILYGSSACCVCQP